MTDARRGFAALAVSTVFWLTFPFIFKAVGHVSSMEVLTHRILWSAVSLWLMLLAPSIRRDLWAVLRNRRQCLGLLVTSLLISSNWLAYVIGVQTGHVLDVSLGFFISPLLAVLLGVVVLREPLRPLQMLAVAIAAAATLHLVWRLGVVPVISLWLAATFSTYGLLRKLLQIPAAAGLLVETTLVVPLALAYLGWLASTDSLAFLTGDTTTRLVLILGGIVTAAPLISFNLAARLLPYSVVGLTLYLIPSLLFIMGITIFHEPLSPIRLMTFAGIWLALAVYLADSFRKR